MGLILALPASIRNNARRASLIVLAGATLLLLPACSTVQIVRQTPSPELLRHCPEPIVSVRTNGELAQALQSTRAALALCNIDKAALREWAEDDVSK